VPADITPELVAASPKVAEPRWSPDGSRLAWVEAPEGRAELRVAPAGPGSDGGLPPLVVASAPAVAVAGARGGTFAWAGSETLVYAGADGALWAVPRSGGPGRVLAEPDAAGGRVAAPAVSRSGLVAFVRETDEA
jgi:hypothetical protein